MRRTRTLLLISLLTAACSTQALQPNRGLERQVEELKARVLELQRKATVSEVEIERLREQIVALQGEVERLSPRRRTHNPNTGSLSPVPDGNSRSSSGPPLVETGRTVEESDLEELDAEVVEDRQAPSGGSSAEGERVAPAVQVLYDRGYTLYHQGRFVDAEASFHRFLEAYAGSELADNAHYWIGECRYARGDLRRALVAFREVVNRYPQGNKTPDALLKIGQTLESLGDVRGAGESYREVRRRFPSSTAAVTAGERLGKGN